MIEDEALSFRFFVCIMNFISIACSIFVLIVINKLRLVHERQGQLISMALIMETLYSFFLLLSQFYYDEPNNYVATFELSENGAGCQVIGLFEILFSITYFLTINVYCFEIQGCLQSNSALGGGIRNAAIFAVSAMLAIFAFFFGAIGFNNLGMCGLLTGFAMAIVNTVIISFSVLINLGCIIQLRKQKALEVKEASKVASAKAKVHNLTINIQYLGTFLITRLIPILIFQICAIKPNESIDVSLYYLMGLPLSMGGICMTIIRAQDPMIGKFITSSIINDDSAQNQRKFELSMQSVTCSEVQSKNQSIEEGGTQKPLCLNPNPYLSLNSTQQDSLQIYRQTYIETDFNYQRFSYQQIIEGINQNKPLCYPKDVFQLLPILIDFIESSPQTFQRVECTPYLMKLMRYLRYESVVAICYAEQLINSVHQIKRYVTSLDPKRNPVTEYSIQQLTSIVQTNDGCVQLEIINRNGKAFLTRHFLKPYLAYLATAKGVFLPKILGLYSVEKESLHYNIMVSVNPVNLLLLEKQGFHSKAVFHFQNGQLNVEMARSFSDLKEKLKLKNKEAFVDKLNESLAFLRENYCWGYSLTIVYLESESQESILPDMFRTRGGVILATIGNLFDQFLINLEDLDELVNPDFYASQLVMQLDKLV